MLNKLIRKYKNLPLAIKASIWFTLCYTLQRGIQFLTMPILTRIIPEEEYGVYSTFNSWFNIISIFSSLGIYGSIFNRAMIKYEEKRDQYISSVQWLTFFVSIAIGFIFIILQPFIENKIGFSREFILLMIIDMLFFPTLQYWYQKQRFEYKYRALVVITLLISIVGTIIGILFVNNFQKKGIGLISIYVTIQTIVCIPLFFKLAIKGKTCYNKQFWHWSVKFAVPLIPGTLAAILMGHADRVMIQQMCGNTPAAIYNVVYQISMVMTIVRTGINGAYIPWLYQSLKQQKIITVNFISKIISLFIGILSVFFMLLGPELIKIAAPESYYEAIIDVPAIILASYFLFVYFLFEQIEFYYEKVIYNSIVSGVGAIINVILNYIFIRKMSYLIAGYTTLITYLMMALLHYVYIIKLGKINKDIKNVFDLKFILILSIVLIVFGILLLGLYELNPIYRYIIILIIIFLAISKKDVIITLLKTIRS